MPMHFETVNRLTFPGFDPHSRQPSDKACAVALARSADGREDMTTNAFAESSLARMVCALMKLSCALSCGCNVSCGTWACCCVI